MHGMPSLPINAFTHSVLPFPGGPMNSAPRFHGTPCSSYAARDVRNCVKSSRICALNVPSSTRLSKLADVTAANSFALF